MMDPKRNIRRLSANAVALLGAVLLCLSLIAVATYAWLSAYWDSNKTNVSFTAGKPEQPILHMWMFDTNQEDTSLSAPGAWVEKTITTDGQYHIIPKAGDAATGSFAIKNIHLGTVDNLVTQKEDNTLYFRLDVKKTIGTTCKLSVKMPDTTDAFAVYRQTNTADVYDFLEKDTNQELYNSLNSHMATLLQVAYATSTDPLTPGTTEFGAMEFSETLPTELSKDAETNYVYIKITPNLNEIANITQYLNKYMPCVVLFDLGIDYEFYTPPV